jgi:hypothetical protein
MAYAKSLASRIKECEGANQISVESLIELGLGIATPLEIQFNPPEPFYPMRMTSINDGNIDVAVYFFGSAPFSDSSGLMSVSNMVRLSENWAQDLHVPSGSFLTVLTYSGASSGLIDDSVFRQATYDPTKEPGYVSPFEMLGRIFFAIPFLIMIGGFFIGIISIPGVFLGLALGALGSYMSRKTGKPQLRILTLIAAGVIMLALIPAIVGLNYLAQSLLLSGGCFLFMTLGFFSRGWKRGPLMWIAVFLIISAAIIASLLFLISSLPLIY